MEESLYFYLKSNNLITEGIYDIAVNYLKVNDNQIILSGNRMGLISLAEHLVLVALRDVRYHTHLDVYNFFEDDGLELIIEHVKE